MLGSQLTHMQLDRVPKMADQLLVTHNRGVPPTMNVTPTRLMGHTIMRQMENTVPSSAAIHVRFSVDSHAVFPAVAPTGWWCRPACSLCSAAWLPSCQPPARRSSGGTGWLQQGEKCHVHEAKWYL